MLCVPLVRVNEPVAAATDNTVVAPSTQFSPEMPA